MVESSRGRPNFTEADLDFVVGEAAPDAPNGERLKELVREDENFRKAMVGDDRVFERLMSDEEIFVKVSPALYFEVLLRRAHKEIELATHTVERTGRQNIPVFDTQAVVGLLARPQVLEYLSQMLASFMRIRSYVVPLQPRGGIRRRVRFNDMDIDSLLHFCAQADEQQRLSFYKRIADVCLFVSGVFPDHSLRVYRQAATTPRGPRPMRPSSRTLEDYEREGRQFYGLAEGHPAAKALDMSRVFGLLREHFASARKPLTFIAGQYLHSRRSHLFGAPTS